MSPLLVNTSVRPGTSPRCMCLCGLGLRLYAESDASQYEGHAYPSICAVLAAIAERSISALALTSRDNFAIRIPLAKHCE